MANRKCNQLPVPTFSWLGVNGTERDIPENKSETVRITGDSETRYLLRLTADAKLEISGGRNPLTVILFAEAEQAEIAIRIQEAYGQKVKLVQIVRGGSQVLSLEADLADEAALELVQIYVNCKDAVSGTEVNLNGRKSVFTSEIGYTLAGSDALDINLNIVQNGRKTESKTNVRGVLRENARKIFRGTIDFRNGAAGATGTEQENVLLLDRDVTNKTVPVILCAEEDVAGSHGATIGQIDRAHIYYMQSRGIPEAQIYEILAQSQLGATVRAIGDAETEQAVNRMLGRETGDE